MKDLEESIQEAVQEVEDHVVRMFSFKFKDSPKPPPIDQFKATAMAEIARRVRQRAVRIEEDWQHFTRE